MYLLDFIHHNSDWKEKLQQAPYCLYINEEDNYYLLKYNQFESDFSNMIVRECRGIILRKADLTVCCRAFDKFFNVQEENAAKIDWASAVVLEKVDGSIIKVWHDLGKWHVSTNGSIDAYTALLGSDLAPVETFGELFDMALNQLFGDNGRARFLEMLAPGFTYMFELAGPYNRIVVPYRTTELYFIGVRNMLSGLEINPWDYPLAQYIKVPERYSLRDIDSCLAAVETMGYDQEGFVVVDKYFNRVKIKSPQYVAAHYLKNNNVQTVGRLLKIILAGEEDEFCSYFPEFRPDFERIEAAYNQLIIALNLSKDAIATQHFETRKDLAIHVIANCKIPEFHFWSYENHWESAENWFRQLPEYKQERLIKNFLGLTL